MRSLICSFLSVVRRVIVTGPLDYIALEGSNLTLPVLQYNWQSKTRHHMDKRRRQQCAVYIGDFISTKPEETSKIIEPCSYSYKADNSFGVNASITVMYLFSIHIDTKRSSTYIVLS